MLLVVLFFLGFLALGMPIAYAIGISGVIFFLQYPELPFTMIVQLPISQTQNFAMLAVPLFVFAGNLMNESGITERLIRLSKVLTGHMVGGLAQVSVVLSTFMGGVSGSAIADAAMEARILGPGMIKNGYTKGYSANVIAFTALITATIPPGVGIIIYGTVGEVSIGQLFAAGLVVGLMMMAILMLTVYITAKRRGYKPINDRPPSFKEVLLALKETIWALLFPFLLLGGIRTGIFTPAEVGAFACVYAVFVGTVVYREFTLKKFANTLINTVQDVGAIMLIIALSGLFGYGIPFERVPNYLTQAITGISTNPHVILLIIIAFLVFIGMFMEGSVTILLFTPILLPMVQAVGVDPVHFGLIFCTIITMGNMTPPVGLAMFAVCQILEVDSAEYVREMFPFMAAIVLQVSVLVFLPDVVLFLPRLLFG
ncbi:MAG: TRAP transporter large permease [Spirochaetales bacterium]